MKLQGGPQGAVRRGEEELVTLMITYARMKEARGEWYGRTGKVYKRHLGSFIVSLPPSVAVDAAKVARRHVQGWLDRNPNHSPAYKRVRLSAVRGFFRWMVAERGLRLDPTAGVVVPDVPEGPPRAFTVEERTRLMLVAERDPRDLLAVSLCFNDAHRRSEISKALIEDIDFRLKTIAVHGKGYRGKVSRIIPYSATTDRALGLYLAREPARTGPLLRNRVNGGGLSPARVGELVASVIRDAGLKQFPGDGRSSHAGRHSVATDLVEAGVDDRIGMRFLGHKSHANWMRYSQGAVLDLRVVHDARGE